jgi:outer membrane protein
VIGRALLLAADLLPAATVHGSRAKRLVVAVACVAATAAGPVQAGSAEPSPLSRAGEPKADAWLAGAVSGPQPALARLIGQAFESSPLLAQARSAAEGGEARLWQARSAYLPTIGAGERFTSTDNPPLAFFSILNQGRFSFDSDVNDPGTVDDWATTLYGRYLIFDFGRREALVSGAEADAERLRLLEAAVRRDVRFTVTAAYFDLVAARAAVHLSLASVRLFEEYERAARSRFEAGEVLRSDPLSVEVGLSAAREGLVTAEHEVEIARSHLATVVGVPVEGIGIPEDALGWPEYRMSEEELIAAALEAHPALLAIDAGVRAARASELAAKRSALPTVGAEVRGEWHGDTGSPGVERESFFAAVVVDFPFFQGGRAIAAGVEAQAKREAAEALRRQAVAEIEDAARTADRRAREALSRIAIADSAVRAARTAAQIIAERYGQGLARVTELLEAERALTEARLRALRARTAAWTAVAAVDRLAREGASS